MHYWSIKYVTICTLALCLLALTGAPAAAQTALVRFEPAEITVGEGVTSAVAIRVENVQKLYGLDIRISFDPAAVEVVDADDNTDGVQMRPGDLLNLDFLVRNEANNETGEVWFALTQMNPSEEVTGSGDAFVITFRGKRQEAASPLSITYVKMSDRKGNTIEADTQVGTVSIVAAAGAPATPTVAPTLPPPTLVAPTRPPATATPIRPTATVTPTFLPTHTPAPTDTLAPTHTPAPTDTPLPAATATTVVAPANTSAPQPTDAAGTTPAAVTEPTATAEQVADAPVESTTAPAVDAAATPTPQVVAAAVQPPTSTPQSVPSTEQSTSSTDDWIMPLAIVAVLGGMAFLVVVAILGLIVWRAVSRPTQ